MQITSWKMVLRNESGEASDFCDLELAGVEPLTLEDITFQDSYVNNHNNRFIHIHACSLTRNNI